MKKQELEQLIETIVKKKLNEIVTYDFLKDKWNQLKYNMNDNDDIPIASSVASSIRKEILFSKNKISINIEIMDVKKLKDAVRIYNDIK